MPGGLRGPALRPFSFPGQARLWVQLMRELRHGVKLKKVQEKEFNPLPTEFQLTPFEMLMQDIRARNYKLRKVMVSKPRPCRPLQQPQPSPSAGSRPAAVRGVPQPSLAANHPVPFLCLIRVWYSSADVNRADVAEFHIPWLYWNML